MVTQLLRSRPAPGAAGAAANVYYVRDSPEVIVPVDANPITVAPPLGTWTWSAWTEITAGLGNDFILTRIVAAADPLTVTDSWRIEIGIGAAASEVAIAEGAWTYPMNVQTVLGGAYPCTQRVNPYRIASSTRIAARVATRGGGTTPNFYIYLQGYDDSGPTIQTLAHSQQDYIDGDVTSACLNIPETSGVAFTPLSAWTFTAWTEISAAAPQDLLIHGIGSGYGGALFVTGAGGLVQLGVGAAAAEVAIAAAGWSHGSNPMWFGHPVLVESGERITARLKSSGWGNFPGVVLLADRV